MAPGGRRTVSSARCAPGAAVGPGDAAGEAHALPLRQWSFQDGEGLNMKHSKYIIQRTAGVLKKINSTRQNRRSKPCRGNDI